VDATFKLDSLKMTINITVGFEDIKLSTLKLVDSSPRVSGHAGAPSGRRHQDGQTILSRPLWSPATPG
jgi:hypothetical protein